MTTPKARLETFADHKAEIRIPDEMMEAYFCHKYGWTVQEYRAQPAHIIEQMRFIWQLENIAEQASRRGLDGK